MINYRRPACGTLAATGKMLSALRSRAQQLLGRPDWRVAAASLVGAAALIAALLVRRAQRAAADDTTHATLAAAPVLLVDNGSLRPASTLSLRRVAARLGSLVGREVVPTSARWSDRIPAAQLGGVAAESTESALLRLAAGGARHAVLLPLFVGPSDTLTDLLPSTVATVRRRCPGLRSACITGPLVSAGGGAADGAADVARILVARVCSTAAGHAWAAPATPLHVAVCDHGTPSPAVNAVRNRVAELVAAALPVELGVRVFGGWEVV